MPPIDRRELAAGAVVILLVSALVAMTTKSEVMLAGNESSRLAAVQALVDQGTFAIDQSIFHTVDKVRVGGRYYSDKPPLLSYWLAMVYATLRALFGVDFARNYHLAIYLITLLGIGSFTILLAGLFYLRLRAAKAPIWLQIVGGAGVVLGTWIFSYSGTVNSHTPAACLLFAGIWALEAALTADSRRLALIAGLLLGVLFNIDLPTGLAFFLGGGAILALDRKPMLVMGAYLLGFTVLIVLMGVLDFKSYGHVLPAYLVPGAYDFPGNIHSQGVAGLRAPRDLPEYLLAITFGGRGVFSYMPVLLIGVVGWYRSAFRLERPAIVWGATSLVVLFYFGTQTGDLGGWAYGFRFLIPLIPLLMWNAALWVMQHQSVLRRSIGALLLVVGAATSLVGAYNPWPVCYEGASTSPKSVEFQVRNTFTANLLCIAFASNPDGPLTQFLAERVYDPNVSRAYLPLAFENMRREQGFQELLRRRKTQ